MGQAFAQSKTSAQPSEIKTRSTSKPSKPSNSSNSSALNTATKVSQQQAEKTQDDKQLARIQKEIGDVLGAQMKAWNAGDIDAFMKIYWKSKDMTFSGGGKMRRGWQATLEQYKSSYPKGSMGQLRFDDLEITLLCDDAAMVLGNWHLVIDDNNLDGNFSLVLRNLKTGWKIIHDHSSSLEPEQGWLTIDQAEQVGRMWLKNPKGIFLTKTIGHYLEISTPQKKSDTEKPKAVYVNRLTAKVVELRPEDLENENEKKAKKN